MKIILDAGNCLYHSFQCRQVPYRAWCSSQVLFYTEKTHCAIRRKHKKNSDISMYFTCHTKIWKKAAVFAATCAAFAQDFLNVENNGREQ